MSASPIVCLGGLVPGVVVGDRVVEFVPSDFVVVRKGKNISKSFDEELWLTHAAPVRGRGLASRASTKGLLGHLLLRSLMAR